jgi:hypothetical protein
MAGPSGITNWVQGALGGGGYAEEIAMDPSGNFFLVRSNLANTFRWKRSTNLFDNVSVSPNMDALSLGLTNYGSPYAHAVGPSNRCYLITSILPPRLGYQAFAADHGQLYRSDDGGNTWFKPGSSSPSTDPLTKPLSVYGGDMYQGPPMAVDPNNADVLYIMGINGAVWVTYDGGVTLSAMTTLMTAALPHCSASGNTGTDGNSATITFKVDSNPVLGNTSSLGVFDATKPFAVGGSGSDFYHDSLSSSTTVTVNFIQSADGLPFGFGLNTPGVANGDSIYFGYMGGIVVDPSEGTVTNTGGTGVRSKLVYFMWQNGATSMWMTTDGGSTFGAVGTGGPSTIYGKMKLSNDANLGTPGGNNVLWLCDGTNVWRWVRTAPTSSGLTANHWTSFANASIFPIGDSFAQCALPDPASKGRVVFIRHSNTPNVSPAGNYGANLVGYTDGVPIIAGGNTGWMDSIINLDFGDACFDPVTSGRIWYATGTGPYYSDVTDSSSLTTVVPQMQILQSLIIGHLVKVPTPYSRIVLSLSQDRALIVCTDENTVPTGYYEGQIVSQTAGTACYALDDPTKIFGGYFNNIYQYDGTVTGAIQNWTKITGFQHTFTVGVIKSFFGLVGGSLYTPTSGTATYNSVALTGGSGSSATANITVTNGAVTAVALVSGGTDAYVLAETLSASAANIGGTGSGFSIRVAEVNSFSTTNSSATVTVTQPSHGFTAGLDRIYLFNITDFNNVTLDNINFSVASVVDANHYTITSSTTANATSFGGSGAICDIHGWQASGWPMMISKTSTHMMAVVQSPLNVQYGTLSGGVWRWTNTTFGGNPLVAAGTNPTSKAKLLVIDPVTGDIWYLDAAAQKLYKSADGGATLTLPNSSGLGSAYVGGTGMTLAVVPNQANNLFWANGRSGDNSVAFPPPDRTLQFTKDGGLNWASITATNYVWSVAVGPAAPGASYPAIYIIAQMAGNGTFTFSIYRCTNFDPNNPNTGTWTDVGAKLKNINCENLEGGIYADPEIYGKIYVVSADTGYMVGSIT